MRKVEIETLPGGFRRTWPGVPLSLPASRDTSLVREVLWRGGNRVVDAARVFGSWPQLMAMAESGWLGPPRASARTTLVEMSERLAAMASNVRTLDQLASCAAGTPAFVLGTVRSVAQMVDGDGPVWECRESRYKLEDFFAAEDPWPLPLEPTFIETAYDFEVRDRLGHRALVRVDGGYLVASRSLSVGATVGVLGYVDSVVHPEGSSRGPREPPTMSVLRSGPALPLLVLTGLQAE